MDMYLGLRPKPRQKTFWKKIVDFAVQDPCFAKFLSAFSLIAQAQRKSFQKETPKRNFALCGARQGLRALDCAAF